MKKIEKIIKQTIIKNKKREFKNYCINYIINDNTKTNKIRQIPKFLYKTNFKDEFSNKTFVKFPLIVTKNYETKYNLLINNELRYILPYVKKTNQLSFTNNEDTLIKNILYVTFPSLKICKLMISLTDH